jgi:hypothetical protein
MEDSQPASQSASQKSLKVFPFSLKFRVDKRR